MPNVLGNYNETFFAQEALIQLEKSLGMAARVHRGYEPQTKARGDTIQIRRPANFTVSAAPAVAQDVTTESVSITLDQWREVKFKLTDKELSLSADEIIRDHIRPAAYALADDVDTALNALYVQVPNYYQFASTFTLGELAQVRKRMFDLKVPLNDPAMLHMQVAGSTEVNILTALGASGMQPNQQDAALRRGAMGSLFGFNVFANQNTPVHTSGVGADATGTVDGINAVGVSTILVSGLTAGITWKKGDTFSLAGDAQRYAFTADGTDADGAAASISFTPALKQATTATQVITIHLGGASKVNNMAFHSHAFALAMAPLSDMGGQLGGARIATVQDPITGLSIRARMFYDGDTSTVYVALDTLFGVKLLNPNLAVRAYEN